MPAPSLKLLERSDIEIIHEKALEILEKTGVYIDNEEALKLLSNAEATIKGKVVKIPRDLVEYCLKSTPSRVLLYDRKGRPYAEIGGDEVYFDPGSAATKILDYGSTEPRSPTLNDLAKLVKLVDALKNIKLQSTALVPSDVPIRLRDRVRLYIVLKNTIKPVVTGAFSVDGVYDMAKMLEIVIGDYEKKPYAIFDVCPSPPLKWSYITSQNLIDCAKRGIPIEIIPMPQLGATSPVTIAGSLLQHHAEALSGIVLAQLARRGSPVIYGGSPCEFCMRYGTANIVSPETLLLSTAYIEIAKYFGLPTHAYMAISDSKTLDYQAGVEVSLSGIIAVLKRVNVVSGPGMLEFENTQSLEKLVLDNDVCGYLLRLLRGFEITEETLAVDVISGVGFTGTFLKERHTVKHLRKEHYFPKVFDRSPRYYWKIGKARPALETAHLLVDKIIREHEPEPLPLDIEKELDKFYESMFKKKPTQ